MAKYSALELGNEHSVPYRTFYKPENKGTNNMPPNTCYDAVVHSLTLTGELSETVARKFRLGVPKARNELLVDPTKDQRLMSVAAIPPNSLIAFYRRFRPGETSASTWEQQNNWVLYHIVRSMPTTGEIRVVGSNNGERAGTNPLWSRNDISAMFDWSGAEPKQSIHLGATVPAAGTYTVGGLYKYVPFAVPIPTAVKRMNQVYGSFFQKLFA